MPKPVPPPSPKRSKASDLAALRNGFGKTQKATFRPSKADERELPVGRKGMMGQYKK